MPKDTSIGIDNELWKRLNSRKGPGDSFEDVISDALDELEELQEANENDDRPDRERADHGGGTTDDFDPNADVDDLLQEESDGADVDQEAIDDVDTPAYSPSRESFEETAEAVIDHTRQRGETSRSVAQEALHANFDAGYPNKRTWWRKVAKPVLESHAKVIAPAEGASIWQFQD